MSKWSEADLPRLDGKSALVTGAASGIGFETARALALAGARVVLADIDGQSGRAAISRIQALRADAKVHFAQLDLSDLDAVKAFAQTLLEQGDPLDLLFNNAGIQPLSTPCRSKNGHELTLAIGHFGHFTLTSQLIPLLCLAAAPRVITTSSLVHRQGEIDRQDLQLTSDYEAQRAYNQTKLANLLFARELQRRADAAGINLLSLAAHPGVARTGIGRNRQRQGPLQFKDHLVGAVLRIVMPLLGQDANQGALPLLYAATVSPVEPGGFYGPNGLGEMKGPPAKAKVAANALDEDLARWLWQTSEALCQVNFAALNSHQRLPIPH